MFYPRPAQSAPTLIITGRTGAAIGRSQDDPSSATLATAAPELLRRLAAGAAIGRSQGDPSSAAGASPACAPRRLQVDAGADELPEAVVGVSCPIETGQRAPGDIPKS